MADNNNRTLTDIIFDIGAHEKILEDFKKEVMKARGTAAFYEAHVCSHAAILRDLRKELADRTGKSVEETMPDIAEILSDVERLVPRIWHTKDERPADDSQVLIVDGDGWGTAGEYGASGDFFAAAAGGLCDVWKDWHIERWAYISDLTGKEVSV